jgi:hypothetical protein
MDKVKHLEMAELKNLIVTMISCLKSKYEVFLLDRYRKRYDSYTFEYKKKKAREWLRKYPYQAHFDYVPVSHWLENIADKPTSVVEIGGWRGDLANLALSSYKYIERWHNYDLLEDNGSQKCQDPKYKLVSLKDYVWNLSPGAEYNSLVATHMIEHISWSEFKELVHWIPESVNSVLFEAPLPESAENHDWSGDFSSHVFEKGWEQVISEMAKNRFTICYKHDNTLMFRR